MYMYNNMQSMAVWELLLVERFLFSCSNDGKIMQQEMVIHERLFGIASISPRPSPSYICATFNPAVDNTYTLGGVSSWNSRLLLLRGSE